jgi:hypothetical protein
MGGVLTGTFAFGGSGSGRGLSSTFERPDILGAIAMPFFSCS